MNYRRRGPIREVLGYLGVMGQETRVFTTGLVRLRVMGHTTQVTPTIVIGSMSGALAKVRIRAVLGQA